MLFPINHIRWVVVSSIGYSNTIGLMCHWPTINKIMIFELHGKDYRICGRTYGGIHVCKSVEFKLSQKNNLAFQIPAACVYVEAKCQECCCGSSGWKIQRKQIHLYHTKQCSLVSSWLKCCRFTLVISSIVLAAVEHSMWHLCTFPLSDWMLGMFWNGRSNVALPLQGLTSCPCAPGDGIVGRAGVHRPFWNRINTLRGLYYMMWHCFSFL